MVTHPWVGHGREVVRSVHAHWERGATAERLGHHGVLVRAHTTHYRTELFLHGARWRTSPEQAQHIRRFCLDLKQLLRVALLDVPREVVLPSKALGTVLAQEIFAPCVDHHVPANILAGVEAAVAVVAGVFLLLGAARRFARVALEVFQEGRSALVALKTNLAGQVTRCGRVHGHVALITKLCVIVLATLLTLEGLFVGVVSLQVILQMIFTVEHLFTE